MAFIDDEEVFDNESGIFATFVRLKRRGSVVGSKFVEGVSVDDEASAGFASGEVHPSADGVKFLILEGVRVYSYVNINVFEAVVFGVASHES